MGTRHNGTHFTVECKVDGIWFADDFVFPTRNGALAFKQREESHGSGNPYRVVATSAPVNLPPEKGEEESEDESSDRDGPSSLFDWSAFLDLTVLCLVSAQRSWDGDLDRLRSCHDTGCCVGGEVFF